MSHARQKRSGIETVHVGETPAALNGIKLLKNE